MRRLILGTCLLIWFSALAHAYTISEIARVDGLLAVLEQRLQISELVARAKWNSGAAIEDPERERQVLESFAEQAAALGFNPVWAREVMLCQIQASKIRQRELFQEWKARRQPAFTNPPDLTRDIRPRLDALAVRLLQSLGGAYPMLDREPALLRWRAGLLWGDHPDPARRTALLALLR